jgi:uncharacterized membrane protein
MKFAVGLMLATFGIFWSVEGVGTGWPGTDLAILGILGFLTLVSMGLVAVLRRVRNVEIVSAARTVTEGE